MSFIKNYLFLSNMKLPSPNPTGVIPAKAGIHKKVVSFHQVTLDPRLRGDDIGGGYNKVFSCSMIIFVTLSLLAILSPTWAMDNEDLFDSQRTIVQGEYKNDGLFDGRKAKFRGPDDFQDEADKMFPDTTRIFSSTEELELIFNPIMEPEAAEIFKTYFDIMFGEGFPKPIHTPKELIIGYRCLYKKWPMPIR